MREGISRKTSASESHLNFWIVFKRASINLATAPCSEILLRSLCHNICGNITHLIFRQLTQRHPVLSGTSHRRRRRTRLQISEAQITRSFNLRSKRRSTWDIFVAVEARQQLFLAHLCHSPRSSSPTRISDDHSRLTTFRGAAPQSLAAAFIPGTTPILQIGRNGTHT